MRTLALTLSLVLCGCSKDGPAGSSKSNDVVNTDGPDLTYREILDRFKAAGYPNAKMSDTRYGQIYLLKPEPDETPSQYADWLKAGGRLSDLKTPLVICQKMASVKEAKEAAGHHESGTWVWGRYYWRGADDHLALVRKVLAK